MENKTIERFNKFCKRAESGCLVWQGAKNSEGYGYFKMDKLYRAHRAAYELFVGPIPEGMLCCHVCDNPTCVEISHLFIGTNQDNMTDKKNKGRCYNGDRKGVKNCKAKLSDDDVREIRKLLSENTSQKIIASFYDVSQKSISAIKNGKTWTHIND